MKVSKRILSGLLAFAMLLSMAAPTAFAASADPVPSAMTERTAVQKLSSKTRKPAWQLGL